MICRRRHFTTFDSPEVIEMLGKLSTLADFDYHEVAVVAVDGFLVTHLGSGETT